jgi:outer membrane protein OmpA-like peptidoglycan-associated protein
VRIKKLFAAVFLCTAFFVTGQAFAEDMDDDFEYDEGEEWINNVPPMSFWGLRGLTQTVSAEPLGMGRLNFSLFGSWFRQEQDLSFGLPDRAGRYGPEKDASVGTIIGKISWGVNNYTDLFGCLPMYILGTDRENIVSIPSELMGGVQFALPIPEEIPLRLAGQIHFVYGLRTGEAANKENVDGVTYGPDYLKESGADDVGLTYAGYEYGEALKRDHLDLVLKFSESLLAGNLRRAVKFHFNEGFVVTPGITNVWLFLLAAGLEITPVEFATIGVEVNWRTPIDRADFARDPFWLTPSLMYRSPYYLNGLVGMNVVVGADIRLSSPKGVFDDGVKVGDVYPLEPWRIFGDLAFSFDLLASKRAEMVRQARANAAEKARLRKQAALTAAQRDSIAAKAREDSLTQAAALAAKAEKARQDSITQAAEAAEREAQLRAEAEGREAQLRADAEQKRIADSVALADANKRLAEERARRSAAEQQMLSTGMIILDGVFFVTGKAEIQLNSRGYLTTLAKMLVRYPKLRMEIGGHTDNTGNLQTNLTLSQKRAEAVFMFLHNLEPSLAQMLTTKGYGPTEPKADNSTAAGREVNRRVELKVLNPEVLREYNP